MDQSIVNVVEDEGEANIVLHKPLFTNNTSYGRLYKLFEPYLKRSYEMPQKWYYIVFKPFNRGYDPQYNGLDECRKKLKGCLDYILTCEVLATKKHYHALVLSTQDLTTMHDKNTKRYKIYSVCIDQGIQSRINLMKYLLKESKERRFVKYIDYAHS